MTGSGAHAADSIPPAYDGAVADDGTQASAPQARGALAGAVAVAAAALLVVRRAGHVGRRRGAADALRVERAPNGAEVVVYLENREANVPATRGRRHAA